MKNIRLLEKRVQQAVERLRQLTEERGRLDEEIRDLRRQLDEALETGATAGEAQAWERQRAEVAAVVRETLSELAAD
jgi:hypothetical protein